MTIHFDSEDRCSDRLFAFAPTGSAITATLEASTTEFPITFFYKADDGSLVPEFSSSGQDRADTDTVTVAGETVFLDGEGKWWLESALTFKTEEGDVVKCGVESAPLDSVDACEVLGDALNKQRAEPSDAKVALAALMACKFLDASPQDGPEVAKAKAVARAACVGDDKSAVDTTLAHPRSHDAQHLVHDFVATRAGNAT